MMAGVSSAGLEAVGAKPDLPRGPCMYRPRETYSIPALSV